MYGKEELILGRIAGLGIGIKTSTYFKFLYPLYTGIQEYGIAHLAIFGMN